MIVSLLLLAFIVYVASTFPHPVSTVILIAFVLLLLPRVNLVQNGGELRASSELTLYYAPWCGYCKSMMGDWDKIAEELKNDPTITVKKVNCDEHPELAEKEKINGFPTIHLKKDNKKVVHDGERTYDGLTSFLSKHGII